MSADYMLMGVDDLPEQDSPSPSPETSTTPTRRGLSQTRASAARRGSVTVACERCRRRKIRCSGLPGPCTSCSKFNVACLDPGKRKQRSSSFLEDRIRALEALAATGTPLDPAAVHSLGTDYVNTSTAQRPIPGPLHIQTTNLTSQAPFDDSTFYSMGEFTDTWSYPATPAHSDMGPDVHSFWESGAIPTALAMDSEADPNFTAPLHRRAQTFPAVPSFTQPNNQENDNNLLSPVFSDLPSIQITSHDGSRSPSPNLNPLDSNSTFTLPFRDTFPLLGEPIPRRTTRTPPILHTDFTHQDINMDYYGDFLSPLDRPPVLARRPSLTPSSQSRPNASHVSEWTSGVSSSTASPNLDFNTPPKRRHTTCSIARTQLTATTRLTPELSWMLSSPRTTNYLTKYFTTIHNEYPFLSRHDFLSSTGESSAFSPVHLTDNPLRTYTRLMTAAIGALLHHQSRDISARYVRHAMSLSSDSNLENVMFTSIQGIHAAMLLAVYLLLEGTTDFQPGKEEEDVSHPEVNPWLWSARVAMGCIDLGLHRWAGTDPDRADSPILKSALGRRDELGEFDQGDLDKSDQERMKTEEEEYDMYDQAEGEKQGFSINSLSPSPPNDEKEDLQLTALYMNTFRSAFLLDRRISDLRRRPTAFHVGDIDGRLLEGMV